MVNELFDFKQDLNKRGIFFCFSGPISQNLLVEIGSTLKKKMKLEDASSSTVLKVFSMVIEKAQNIIHYSDEKIPGHPGTDSDELSLGIIAVGVEGEHYFVLCGNMIENCKVKKLKEKLTQIQNMSKEDLKAFYKEQRKKDPDEGSKGAGLGFIDMARKASRPIEFDFKEINDKFSFFSVKTVI